MRAVLVSTVSAALLLVAACGKKSSEGKTGKTSTFSIDSVKAEINELNTMYGADRFVSNDEKFYNDHYMPDAIVFPAEHPAVSGRTAIREFFYDGGKNKDLVISISATHTYGDEDLVIEEGVYNFPDGQGGSFDKGKYLVLWKTENGKWKIYREIWNTDIAPPRTIQ